MAWGGEELVAAVTISVEGANFDLRLSSYYDNVLRARMQQFRGNKLLSSVLWRGVALTSPKPMYGRNTTEVIPLR